MRLSKPGVWGLQRSPATVNQRKYDHHAHDWLTRSGRFLPNNNLRKRCPTPSHPRCNCDTVTVQESFAALADTMFWTGCLA
eukprot:490795-Amphidinium_carterae.1